MLSAPLYYDCRLFLNCLVSYPHFNQFEHLSQEQRDELRAEILAEELIKLLIEAERARVQKTPKESEVT